MWGQVGISMQLMLQKGEALLTWGTAVPKISNLCKISAFQENSCGSGNFGKTFRISKFQVWIYLFFLNFLRTRSNDSVLWRMKGQLHALKPCELQMLFAHLHFFRDVVILPGAYRTEEEIPVVEIFFFFFSWFIQLHMHFQSFKTLNYIFSFFNTF